jgi:DNA-binding beta-propeller fold protein YncE
MRVACLLTLSRLYYSLAVTTMLSGILHIAFGLVLDSTSSTNVDTSNPLQNFVGTFMHSILFRFFIPVGIVQILWSLFITGHPRLIWCYVGIAAMLPLMLLWLFVTMLAPIIINDIYSSGILYEFANTSNFYSLISMWRWLGMTSMAIFLSQVTYIILSIITIAKKTETISNREKIPCNRLSYYLGKKARPLTLPLILSIVTALMVSSTIFSSHIVAYLLLHKVDQFIPDHQINPPIEVAINPKKNLVYVLNAGSGGVFKSIPAKITVINGSTNTIIDNVTLTNENPDSIAVNPDTGIIYASDGAGTVSVINSTKNVIVKEIFLGGIHNDAVNAGAGRGTSLNFYDIAINPKTNMMYVLNNTEGTIYTIDGTTNRIVDHIGSKITGDLLVDAKNNLIYGIGSSGDITSPPDKIIRINATDKTVKTYNIQIYHNTVNDIALNTRTNIIYAAARGGLYVINASSSRIHEVRLAGNFKSLSISPKSNMVYATTTQDGFYAVNSTDESSSIVPLPVRPSHGSSAITVNSETIYVLSSSNLYIVNGGSIRVSKAMGSFHPEWILLNKDVKLDEISFVMHIPEFFENSH